MPQEAVTAIEYHPDVYRGIRVEQDSRRVYPQGEMCATLVGQVRKVGSGELQSGQQELRKPKAPEFLLQRQDPAYIQRFEGRSGLEKSYDQELRGLYGRCSYSYDSRDKPHKLLEEIAIKEGKDIQTTLDMALQKALYNALEETFGEGHVNAGARGGAAAVMDVRSGALLASVGFPACDPHRGWGAGYAKELKERWDPDNRWRVPGSFFTDRPSRSVLYPGSAFKIVMAAAALEVGHSGEGKFDQGTRYDCEKHFPLDPAKKNRLSCLHYHGELDLAGALQHSCNIYFYYLAYQNLHTEDIRSWAQKLGYGVPAGVDLPWNTSARLDGPEKVTSNKKRGHYAIGKVYVEATPLQVLRSVAAIAGGGKSVPHPYVVRRRLPPTPLKFSNPRTLQVLREGMWRAGHDPGGTAEKEGELSSFNAAYKTGTAEVKEPEGEPERNHAWLVGFAPFQDPKIAFVVVIDRSLFHGAKACGPVAKALLEHFEKAEPELYRAPLEDPLKER